MGEKSGFALVRSKKDAERWEKNVVFALLADAKTQSLVLLKEGAISTKIKIFNDENLLNQPYS